MRKPRFKSYTGSKGCPVEATLEIVGGKWKGLILYHLLEGPRRFGELNKSLPGVTPRTLTKQLRELEADQLVNRKVFPVVPPHVEYRLSKRGESLRGLLLELKRWGEKHLVGI